jgi:2,3-bisphosphoglycerate-independent phosphoglycerate mutase
LRVILLFLDGVGIGKRNPDLNPFFAAQLPVLRRLLGGSLPSLKQKRIRSSQAELVPVNATLRVPGLPQSGTGQTAIFTGVNGARMFGRHFGPYPPTILRPVIESKNIFRLLKTRGKSVSFANAFPQRFFDYTRSGTRRLTVTTLAAQMAGVPLLTSKELQCDEGISPDFIRTRWPELGHPEVRPVTPEEAGRHLWRIATRNDFTVFEYWLTDHAGHSQNMKLAIDTLERFDSFLGGILEGFDATDSLLVTISDHGNVEDLATKSHTRNPVPCIAAGKNAHKFVSSVKDLTHITPAILGML